MRQITDLLGTRAYGAFIILLTIPNFIPGVSLVSAALLILFCVQMSYGIKRHWLPKVISNYTIALDTVNKIR